MGDFIYKSAIELAEIIRKGEATSVDITKEHLAQIQKHNDALNAVIIHTENEALKTAEQRDKEAAEGNYKGPLHGVPMTIKEQFWLEGEKATMNFNRYKDFVAPEDALIVDRLKKAGAVIMGSSQSWKVRKGMFLKWRSPAPWPVHGACLENYSWSSPFRPCNTPD